MKILFVSSGNSKNGITPIILNQGHSLKEKGHLVEFFSIKGKGWRNYIKAIFKLRTYTGKNNFDIIHAHYAYSAIVAGLAARRPVVTSLMGTDVYKSKMLRIIIRLFSRIIWKSVIVKSQRMKSDIGLKLSHVVPNGVDLQKFKPMPGVEARKRLQWAEGRKHILFAANPARSEKNHQLFLNAIALLGEHEFEHHALVDLPHEDIPLYMNAADVVVLTSLYEGSPNVIKEALACNRPIVSTDVGDVSEHFSGLEGCYVAQDDPKDISSKISMAWSVAETQSRTKISHLSTGQIAERILEVYQASSKKHYDI